MMLGNFGFELDLAENGSLSDILTLISKLDFLIHFMQRLYLMNSQNTMLLKWFLLWNICMREA
jgi:hypothetical protein